MLTCKKIVCLVSVFFVSSTILNAQSPSYRQIDSTGDSIHFINFLYSDFNSGDYTSYIDDKGKILYVETYESKNLTFPYINANTPYLRGKYFYENDSTYYARLFLGKEDFLIAEGRLKVDYKHWINDTIQVVDTNGVMSNVIVPLAFLVYKDGLWKEYSIIKNREDTLESSQYASWWQGRYIDGNKKGIWTYYNYGGLPMLQKNYDVDSTKTYYAPQNAAHDSSAIIKYLYGRWQFRGGSDSLLELIALPDSIPLSNHISTLFTFYNNNTYKIFSAVGEGYEDDGHFQIKKQTDGIWALVLNHNNAETEIYRVRFIDKKNLLFVLK